jgi:hypothetical protein
MSQIVNVTLTDTLMAWTGEFHVQSGDRHSTFYFRVPDNWTADPTQLQQRLFTVAQQMYADLNERFHAAESNDLGYLAVLAVQAIVLTPAEAAITPWLTAPNPAVWEWTPCVIVHEDGSYEKVGREAFS